MIREYIRKLTDKVNYQLLLAILGTWTVSSILYWKKNIVFWELDLFRHSGKRVGRHVVSWVQQA